MLRRLLAATCAAGAVLLLVGLLRPPAPPTVPATVAGHALPAGVVLTRADLSTVQLPTTAQGLGAVAGLDDLVGRRLATAVEAGELVTASRLVPRSAVDGLPRGTVAAHLSVADPRALDLVSAGRRVTLFAENGGPPLARDVLVLGLDTPDTSGWEGSFPAAPSAAAGLVVALNASDLEAVFAGQRPDGGPPRVLPVIAD